MAKTIKVDFSNAPPATRGPRLDVIPEGTYPLEVLDGDVGLARNNSGRTVVSVQFGVTGGREKGCRVGQSFTMPKDSEDSIFGLQQFHAFLVGCGMKKQKGEVTVDLTSVIGKKTVSEVESDFLPATNNRPEREISRPVSFMRPKSEEAKESLAREAARSEADDEDGTEDESADDEAPAAATPSEEAESLDDLFSDDEE